MISQSDPGWWERRPPMISSLENRSGRVVALARTALAIVFVCAALEGLRTPALFTRTTLWVTLAYAAFALLSLAASWSSWWMDQRLKLPTHLIDVALFVGLNAATG